MLALGRLLTGPAALLATLAALIPLATVAILGLPAIAPLLANPVEIAATLRTLLLAEASTAIALPLGLLAALGLWTAPLTLRRIAIGLCVLPLLLPALWVTTGFRQAEILSPFPGIHLAALIAAKTAPPAALVLLTLTAALNRIDPAILRAAAAAGARPTSAFLRLVAPQLGIPLVIAAAIAFAAAIGQTEFDPALVPAHHPTLAVLLHQSTEAGSPDAAPQAAILALIALSPLALLAALRLLRHRNPA